MYCYNCGQKIDDNAEICIHCGVRVKKESFTIDINLCALIGFILSLFTTLPGLICSIIGYKKSKAFDDRWKGFAIAGIIICSVKLALGLFGFLIYLRLVALFLTPGVV